MHVSSNIATIMAGRCFCCVFLLSVLCFVITLETTCFAMNLHEYIPISESGERSREEYVQTYFNLGFPYEEILVFLSKFHGIVLSLRQLKRILKAMGLQRRKIRSSVHAVVSAIEGNYLLGYRAMHQRLTIDYN